jgi:hypothetical protein
MVSSHVINCSAYNIFRNLAGDELINHSPES